MAEIRLSKGWLLAAILGLAVAGYGVAGVFYKQALYDGAMGLEASLSGLQEKQTEISIGTISYYDNGQVDKPKVLLVHGFAAYKENWLRFARPFKNQYHVVAVDLPGHGKSVSALELDYSLSNQVAWLHEFSQTIGFQQFHMAGNSMGGAITAVYAATHPEQILTATLLDPAGVHQHRSVMQDLIDEGRNPLVVNSHEDFKRLMDFALEQPPFIPWPVTVVSAERAKAMKPVHDKLWFDMSREQDSGFKALLPKIQAPTLVQWGDQDRVLNYKNAEVFKALIPNAQVHIWPGVGHAPMIEIPSDSAQLMLSHLAGRLSNVASVAE